MRKPIILFRDELSVEGELQIAKQYFDVVEYRSEIPSNSLVIGRYSCLPYYNELEKDVTNIGSQLINTYKQHQWIANFEYYEAVKDHTFKTWFSAVELPDDGTQFVVKGVTNSRKNQWDTLMFASNKRQAIEIMFELQKDSLIGSQPIIFRKYEPLVTYETGINNQPFTNEWRFFLYKEQILSFGYYWSQAYNKNVEIDTKGIELVKSLAPIVSQYVNFYVLDVGQKQDGSWVLIEINDGQQSGLSENDPHVLYSNLISTLLF
jgi:hypothetical protein